MTQSARCQVCGEASKLEIFELAICQRCFDEPADALGSRIDVEHKQHHKIEQLSTIEIHEVRITVAPQRAAAVSAKFTHEGFGHKLIKVFKDEYQAGDAAFDNAIYIADEHRASTEALLARAGARASILRLVGENNQVIIEHGTIKFEASDEKHTDLVGYLRAALALSLYIQALE